MILDDDDTQLLTKNGLNGRGFYLRGAGRTVPQTILDNDRPLNEALLKIARNHQGQVAERIRKLSQQGTKEPTTDR